MSILSRASLVNSDKSQASLKSIATSLTLGHFKVCEALSLDLRMTEILDSTPTKRLSTWLPIRRTCGAFQTAGPRHPLSPASPVSVVSEAARGGSEKHRQGQGLGVAQQVRCLLWEPENRSTLIQSCARVTPALGRWERQEDSGLREDSGLLASSPCQGVVGSVRPYLQTKVKSN